MNEHKMLSNYAIQDQSQSGNQGQGQKKCLYTLPPKEHYCDAGDKYKSYLFSDEFTLDDYISLEAKYPEYFNDANDFHAVYTLPMGENTLTKKT
jgi:hypothetical protein